MAQLKEEHALAMEVLHLKRQCTEKKLEVLSNKNSKQVHGVDFDYDKSSDDTASTYYSLENL